jgi:hypothetical protein
MFLFGIIGFTYSAINMIIIGASLFRIVKRSLDTITITVPPALRKFIFL